MTTTSPQVLGYYPVKTFVSWHDTTLLLDANMPDKQKAYPDITARIRQKKFTILSNYKPVS